MGREDLTKTYKKQKKDFYVSSRNRAIKQALTCRQAVAGRGQGKCAKLPFWDGEGTERERERESKWWPTRLDDQLMLTQNLWLHPGG